MHYLVEHDEPLLERPKAAEPDKVTGQIATHLAQLVPDRATLRLGIGRIPEAVDARCPVCCWCPRPGICDRPLPCVP